MIMKKILLILLLSIFAFVANAQMSYNDVKIHTKRLYINDIDVIYLKNGSVIKGNIIEEVPNKSITLKTADGSNFVFEIEKIKKIVKEEANYSSFSKGEEPQKNKFSISGIRGFIDATYAFDVYTPNQNRLEMSISDGYQIFSYVFIGAGFGIHYYDMVDKFKMPFFVDFRVNFLSGRVVPFLGTKIGYTVNLSDSLTGEGFYSSNFVGVKCMISKRKAINIAVSYIVQDINLLRSQAIGVTIGFEF